MANRPVKPKWQETPKFKRESPKARKIKPNVTKSAPPTPVNQVQNNRLMRVTKQDILNSYRQSYENCPIGQAFRAAGLRAGVTRDSIIINPDTSQEIEISLHPELSQWVVHWDQGDYMSPTSFLINMEYRTTLPALVRRGR